jgi:hypothetical protein
LLSLPVRSRLPVLRGRLPVLLRRPRLPVLRRPRLPARLLPLLLSLNVRPPGLARCLLALQLLCWWLLALWMDWLGWALLWLSRLD